MLRLAAWLAQAGIFVIIIIVEGNLWYPGDSNMTFNQTDSVSILVVGAIGAACLVPLPFVKTIVNKVAMLG